MQEKFSFFAPAYLAKSGDPKKPIRVGGIISTEKKDADGETIITKGLELDYFTGGFGKIKYEHDTELSKEPENIIGFPDIAIKKSNGLHFEGDLVQFEGIPDNELTPQAKTAKAAYGLLKAVEAWNQMHPNNPQKVGWSIEGEYLKRQNGTVHKARITNVVLTTKPKNTGTFAQIIKSLEVGYSLSPEDKTGFGATATESFDKCNKNNFTKGDKKMFKSKEEAYKAYLSQGLSEQEAKEKAEQWKPEENSGEEAFKSFNGSKDYFQKAIESVKELEGITVACNASEMKKSLDNSLQAMKNGESVDITEYFKSKQEADMKILENIEATNQRVNLLAKSICAIAEGLTQLATGNEHFNKSLNVISQAEKLTAKGVTMLIKGKSTQSGLTTDNLEQYRFDDNNKPDAKLTKSQKVQILADLAREGKVTQLEVMEFETNPYQPLRPEVEAMVKAKASTTLS